MADSKIKFTNTHKTFLSAFGGTLVAFALMLGSVGVVRAIHGPNPRGGDGHRGLVAEADFGHEGMGRVQGGMGGEVTKIDGNTITLKGHDDAVITVTVDSDTQYKAASNDAKLSDIKVGDDIAIRGKATSMSVSADSIGIRQ